MASGALTAALVAVAALAAAPHASAQRTYNPELWLGGKAGYTLSQVAFTPSVPEGWLPGMTAGVVMRYTEEKLFGLIAELSVTQRGWRENFDAAPFSYDRRLTYLHLPVMTHIYFGRKVKGFVNLGPTVSYLLGSSISANFDYRDPQSVAGFPSANRMTAQLDMDIKNRLDYGITGGVGVQLTIARRHTIMLEGRYYFGIGNIFPSAKRDVFSASRGSSIEITLGYMLRVK